jgi:hypothetical protein
MLGYAGETRRAGGGTRTVGVLAMARLGGGEADERRVEQGGADNADNAWLWAE